VLRVHFTSEDLSRTTLATDPDPLWEVVLSRFRLTESAAFRPWVQRLAAEGRPVRARIGAGVGLLSALAPSSPYFPDFLTPRQAGHGIDHGLDALLSTPRTELGGQLAQLAAHRRVPDWTRRLAEGEIRTITWVADTLREYHDVAIAPHSGTIHAAVAADVAHRTRCLHTGGLNVLFESFRPMMRWNPPVLECDYVVDRDLHLEGRGLQLVPSFFCHRRPITFADPELPPLLVYPIAQEYRWQHLTRSAAGLDALMGRTRATVLRAVHSGATATELARRLNTSPASVSRHTAVLRDVGLIVSRRDGQSVLHALTPLGMALVEGPDAGRGTGLPDRA
jgi:DNA-binding transcriptional ArsR family regulator